MHYNRDIHVNLSLRHDSLIEMNYMHRIKNSCKVVADDSREEISSNIANETWNLIF